MKSGLNQYFEEVLLNESAMEQQQQTDIKVLHSTANNKVTLSQYFEKELLEETSASERNRTEIYQEEDEEMDHNPGEDEIDFYTSYASYMSSSDPGSDNILVTIDYGSMEDGLSVDSLEILKEHNEDDAIKNNNMLLLQVPPRYTHMTKIREEQSKDTLNKSSSSLLRQSQNPFQVHRMQHSSSNVSSVVSLVTSLTEYNVDTSGDYGSWQHQTESENEEDGGDGARREYRYEDLIKNEIFDDLNDDGNGAGDYYDDKDMQRNVAINDCVNQHIGAGSNVDVDDDDDVLVDYFNYDEALSARWSSENDKLYYRSVDFLN